MQVRVESAGVTEFATPLLIVNLFEGVEVPGGAVGDVVGAHDPLAALVMLGASHHTKATIVNGRVVARDGHLVSMDEQSIRSAADGALGKTCSP
mgnify:CR=1 FL=1